MSNTFVPNLDFSAFKDQEFNWSDEEVQAAIEAADRKSLPVGVHDVTVVSLDETSFKFCDNNPNWCQVKLICENAAKETYQHVFMMPLSMANTKYKTRSGAETPFAFSQFCKFCAVLGYDTNTLCQHVCRTEGRGLADLIGCQFRVMVQWAANKVHLQFDKDSNCHFLVNAKGERASEEPFSIPEKSPDKPDRERYAEVEAYCRANGMFLQIYPDRKLFRIDAITNPPLGGVAKKSSVKKVKVEVEDDDEEEEEVKETKPKNKKKKSKPPPMPEPEDIDDDEDGDDDSDDSDDE